MAFVTREMLHLSLWWNESTVHRCKGHGETLTFSVIRTILMDQNWNSLCGDQPNIALVPIKS